MNPRVLSAIANSRHRPELISSQGLVANNAFSSMGRRGYFPSPSATSESQFLLIAGVARAAIYTGDPQWKPLLSALLSNIISTYYRGVASSSINWMPHWLACAKRAFQAEVMYYSSSFTFVNGVATIPPLAPSFGNLVRQVFHARSLDSLYLWQNPYSTLTTGILYPVASVTTDQITGTVVTLTDTTVNADCYIMYSTASGDPIIKGQPFEAWPGWRALDPTEVSVAVDAVAWAVDAYQQSALALADQTYTTWAENTLAGLPALYTVNDGRSWFSSGIVPPMGLIGAYVYNNIVPDPTLTLDPTTGDIVWDVLYSALPASGTPEAQYGRGGLGDAWQAADEIALEVSVDTTYFASGTGLSITLTVFIQNNATYSGTARYAYYLNLTANGQVSLVLSRSSFVNSLTATPAVGDPIVVVGLDFQPPAGGLGYDFKFTLSELRPIPLTVMPYMPGAAPFTGNYLGTPQSLIGWRGPVYSGYQNPWVWSQVSGATVEIANQLSYLQAAQAAYTAQVPGISGPFAPVYVLPRWDSSIYGSPNTFTWGGPDPNTGWGGYQIRPAEATARYWYGNPGDTTAQAIVVSFLTWVAGAWVSSTSYPPTDFLSTGAPESNYDDPHFVALALRMAIYADLAGASQTLTRPFILQCLQYLQRLYVTTGRMAGTWSSGVSGGWFGFWNGEILASLILALDTGNAILSAIGFSAATIDSWVSGNLAYLVGRNGITS